MSRQSQERDAAIMRQADRFYDRAWRIINRNPGCNEWSVYMEYYVLPLERERRRFDRWLCRKGAR